MEQLWDDFLHTIMLECLCTRCDRATRWRHVATVGKISNSCTSLMGGQSLMRSCTSVAPEKNKKTV